MAIAWPHGLASRTPGQFGAFRWYDASAVFGAVAASSLLDESLRNTIQDHRSTGSNDAARVFRHMGQPEVYATVALGTMATGLVAHRPAITRAGMRITASLLVAGGLATVLKRAWGRRRPYLAEEQYVFHPLTRDDSWPSGHATMAFALATSVSDEIHSTPATIGLYSLATLTAWSRLNDNKHWLSDVLAGAALGFTSAKFMGGRWRVFGIQAPAFLLGPGGAGLEWEGKF